VSASEALRYAANAGVQVCVDGHDLDLAASFEPPAEVVHLLTRHKAEVVALLHSTEDWHAYFTERAGIAEYDGKLSREQAEAQAYTCWIVKWLEFNSESFPPGRCLSCGGPAQSCNPLLPYGVGRISRACLHYRCWAAWHRARRAQAAAALGEIGIKPVCNRDLQQRTQHAVEADFLPSRNIAS
jgi:hypothetical protein